MNASSLGCRRDGASGTGRRIRDGDGCLVFSDVTGLLLTDLLLRMRKGPALLCFGGRMASIRPLYSLTAERQLAGELLPTWFSGLEWVNGA